LLDYSDRRKSMMSCCSRTVKALLAKYREKSREDIQQTPNHDLTPRMCRTTFATLFQSEPRDLQDFLGHSTVDLTMEVYKKPITMRQRAAVEELEARLSGKVVAMPIRESA